MFEFAEDSSYCKRKYYVYTNIERKKCRVYVMEAPEKCRVYVILPPEKCKTAIKPTKEGDPHAV